MHCQRGVIVVCSGVIVVYSGVIVVFSGVIVAYIVSVELLEYMIWFDGYYFPEQKDVPSDHIHPGGGQVIHPRPPCALLERECLILLERSLPRAAFDRKGGIEVVLRDLDRTQRLESGLDCTICAVFFDSGSGVGRQRSIFVFARLPCWVFESSWLYATNLSPCWRGISQNTLPVSLKFENVIMLFKIDEITGVVTSYRRIESQDWEIHEETPFEAIGDDSLDSLELSGGSESPNLKLETRNPLPATRYIKL